MNINRVISMVRTLKESPTNNTGSNGSTAGFSAAASGAMTGYDKLLHEPILDQDYQTPYGLNYRLANVFPVNKVSETDVDNIVDASKEYMDLSDKSNNDSRLDKLISIVKSIREEVAIANNASSGAIAGLPPDSPPVFKKKRKPTPVGRYGSRRMWLQDLRKDGK
jgi:hypothetical protein|tara:strand:- start:103 stop:597 length:495 start_codon:yes stop_codon:yes gene_type:complete